MDRFFQLHLLTPYPPSNVNRDDLGNPKTAVIGGHPRLRISSQALKRAWRTSDVFANAVGEAHIGSRTRQLPQIVLDRLLKGGVKEKDATKWAEAIGGRFGKVEKAKKKDGLAQSQLVHISQTEMEAVESLADALISENREPSDDELALLKKDHRAADIALFGRMLANTPSYNTDAACQVAHAFSVERVVSEDDWFTAVDDLRPDADDAGSAHLGSLGFGAAVYYLYVCIDRSLLLENVGGDKALAASSIRGLVESAATIAPGGKQNSFGSRVHAVYGCGELDDYQPRSLVAAFFKPITGNDRGAVANAIGALKSQKERFDSVYGREGSSSAEFNVEDSAGSGKLVDLVALATSDLA